MNDQIQQMKLIRQQISNLELSIEELLERAETDQRITHAKFLADHWTAALDLLETQLNSTRALLKRIETIGR